MKHLRILKIKDWHFIGLIALLTLFIHVWGVFDSEKEFPVYTNDCLSELDNRVFMDSISSRMCFVLFYAENSKLCDRVLTDLNQVAEKNEKGISFFKVNVDKYPECCDGYAVYGIPSVIIFHEGEEINRIMGVVPKRNYELIYNKFANLVDDSRELQANDYRIWLGDRSYVQ